MRAGLDREAALFANNAELVSLMNMHQLTLGDLFYENSCMPLRLQRMRYILNTRYNRWSVVALRDKETIGRI